MRSEYEAIEKRAFDVTAAVVALLLFSVPMAVIWAIVRGTMGAPAIFRQVRLGRHGTPFTLYKFRTMRDVPPNWSLPVSEGERITRPGAFLRRSSLDELPELLNVLLGDMSLVGPRPLLPQYLHRYSVKQARRLETRPGITGWAQVNGRNALSWDEKFELDVWYVDNWSIGLDLKILWMTIVQMIKREGVNAHGHATMPEFMGPTDDPSE